MTTSEYNDIVAELETAIEHQELLKAEPASLLFGCSVDGFMSCKDWLAFRGRMGRGGI